eukprot:6213944-Pleurochrysis_carterae.AAC.2
MLGNIAYPAKGLVCSSLLGEVQSQRPLGLPDERRRRKRCMHAGAALASPGAARVARCPARWTPRGSVRRARRRATIARARPPRPPRRAPSRTPAPPAPPTAAPCARSPPARPTHRRRCRRAQTRPPAAASARSALRTPYATRASGGGSTPPAAGATATAQRRRSLPLPPLRNGPRRGRPRPPPPRATASDCAGRAAC